MVRRVGEGGEGGEEGRTELWVVVRVFDVAVDERHTLAEPAVKLGHSHVVLLEVCLSNRQ